MKKVYKSFFYDLDKLELWLNQMAGKGYRLVDTKGLQYIFEDCHRGMYEYRVELAGGLYGKELNEYEEMLKELGYCVYRRSISFGQKSIGKRRLNLATGQFENRSTVSPNSQVRSIFVIERKKTEKPFDLYTDSRDLSAYYSRVRDTFIIAAIMVFLIALLGSTQLGFIQLESVRFAISILVRVAAAGFGIWLAALGIKAQKKLSASK